MKNKKDISFLIPTNRPHEFYLNKTLERIKNIDNLGFDYEILVSTTQDDVDTDNVKFFKDTDNQGSIAPINYLASQSCGDYLCVLVDDYLPSYNLFSIVNFLKSDLYKNRKFKVTSLSISVNNFKLPPELVPPSVMHPYTKHEQKHDRYFIMKFPVMDRNTYKLLGEKIFHPHFVHHAADNYLSIYLGFMGEPTMECSHITLHDWAGRNSKTEYDIHETIVLYHLIKNLNKNYYDPNLIFNNTKDLQNYYLNKE